MTWRPHVDSDQKESAFGAAPCDVTPTALLTQMGAGTMQGAGQMAESPRKMNMDCCGHAVWWLGYTSHP